MGTRFIVATVRARVCWLFILSQHCLNYQQKKTYPEIIKSYLGNGLF